MPWFCKHGVTRSGTLALVLTIAVGLIVRIALVPIGSFRYDTEVMQNWSHHLVATPLPRFYAEAFKPDHLPGDLLLLSFVAHVFTVVRPGVPFSDDSYLYALKAVPFVADIAIALMLFAVGAARGWGNRSFWLSAAYLLNPAIIFVSAIWGQWDAVSAAFALAAVISAIRHRWGLSVLLLGLGCLVKPQLALLLPLIAIVTVCTHGWKGLQRAITGGLAAVAIALVVSLPFNVSIWPIPSAWTFFDRLQYSLDTWQRTTARALNVWILPIGAGNAPLDAETWWGISYQHWGMLGFAVVYGCILVTLWRAPRANRQDWLIWSVVTATFGWYLLFTRVHERYLFPTILFTVLWLAWERRALWLLAPLSAIYLANLYWVYDLEHPAYNLTWLDRDLPVVLMALGNVMLFAITLTWPWWHHLTKPSLPTPAE